MEPHDSFFSRASLLLGDNAMKSLQATRVIVFGIGGVGSWAAETLVRTGVGHLILVDFDKVSPSNINRQLPATSLTIGCSKVEAMKLHLLQINPEAEITAIDGIYSPETADNYNLDSFDYVIDAIDSLRDKALLINNATRSRARLFSSMGAALKTDPSKIAVTEFWKVKGCRLAAALRQRFKREGIFPARKFKAVYSPELLRNLGTTDESLAGSPTGKVAVNGSLMQITAVFGIMLASLVINDVASKQGLKTNQASSPKEDA